MSTEYGRLMCKVWEAYLQLRFQDAAKLYTEAVERYYLDHINRVAAYHKIVRPFVTPIAFADICKADPFIRRVQVHRGISKDAEIAIAHFSAPPTAPWDIDPSDIESLQALLHMPGQKIGASIAAHFGFMCGLAAVDLYDQAFRCLEELLRMSSELPIDDRRELHRYLASQRHFARGSLQHVENWQRREPEERTKESLRRAFGIKYAQAIADWVDVQTANPAITFSCDADEWRLVAMEAALRIFDHFILDAEFDHARRTFDLVLEIAGTLPEHILKRFRRSEGKNCIYNWGTILDPVTTKLSPSHRAVLASCHGRLESLAESPRAPRVIRPIQRDGQSMPLASHSSGLELVEKIKNETMTLEQQFIEHVYAECPAVSLVDELTIHVIFDYADGRMQTKFHFIRTPQDFTERLTPALLDRLIDVIHDFRLGCPVQEIATSAQIKTDVRFDKRSRV